MHLSPEALATIALAITDVLAQIDPQVITITASFAALIRASKRFQVAFAALIDKAGGILCPNHCPTRAMLFGLFIAKTKAATIAIKGFQVGIGLNRLGSVDQVRIGEIAAKLFEMKGETADSAEEIEKAAKEQKRFTNIIKSDSIPAITKEIALTKSKIKEAIAEGKAIDDLTDKMEDLVKRRQEIIVAACNRCRKTSKR